MGVNLKLDKIVKVTVKNWNINLEVKYNIKTYITSEETMHCRKRCGVVKLSFDRF